MLEKTEGVIKNGQSRHTSNIVYTKHRMKTNEIRDTTQKSKKMSNTDLPKTGGEPDIGGNLSY
jgi:hypothetical protein